VEAVAAYAFIVEVPGQREACGNVRQAMMECGVEAADLR